MGTVIVRGEAHATVIATGAQAVLGATAVLLKQTPL